MRERLTVQLLPLPTAGIRGRRCLLAGRRGEKVPPRPAPRVGAGGSGPGRSVWGRIGLMETDTVGPPERVPARPVMIQGKPRQEGNGLLARTPTPPRESEKSHGRTLRLNVATGLNSLEAQEVEMEKSPRVCGIRGTTAKPLLGGERGIARLASPTDSEALKGVAFPRGRPRKGAGVRGVGGAPAAASGQQREPGPRPGARSALGAPGAPGSGRLGASRPSAWPAPAPPAPQLRLRPSRAAAPGVPPPPSRAPSLRSPPPAPPSSPAAPSPAPHRAHSAAVHFAL